MKFQTTRLDNGLTIIGERDDSAASVALGFFVRTGARDETPEISGVSHFLEHMMFKGTAKRSALDVTYALGAIGAQANAYTSEETTVYYAYVLPEYFPRAFEILADMLQPALDPGEFTTEKKVILEEIALYQDRPTYVMFERALREHFHDHPAGNSVLGSIESITNLTRDQMKSYFDARYAPSNMVLTVTGNFAWSELVDLAGRYCGSWVDKVCPREVRPNMPENREVVVQKEDLQVAHLCWLAPGPSATDEERYPAHVLSCILGDSFGSRAYWELVDKGLADAASIDIDEMDGTGMIMGYVSGQPDRIDAVGGTLRDIMCTPTKFDDDELQRAKTKIATRMVLSGESPRRRLMAIGNDWIYRGEYATLEEELARIKAVSREEVVQMLERFSFIPTTKVALLPGPSGV